MPPKKTTSSKAVKPKVKAKVTKKVVKKTVRKPLISAKKSIKTMAVKDDCCGGKGKEDCCKTGGDDCCCCSEGRGFWTALVVIVLLVVLGYFVYNNYREQNQANYFVEETNGVTTITPGPGMTPDGPPMVTPPTAPPTN